MDFLKRNIFSYGIIGLLYRTILLLFGVVEIALLWVMSISFICYISNDENEATFFCKDNAILNILIIVLFIIVLYLLSKRPFITSFKTRLSDDIFFKKVKKYLLWIIAAIGFIWVIITQYIPGADQIDVLGSAYRYGVGATDMVRSGGYLDKWPHNIGITTLETILARVFGDFNIIFMQLLNVPGLVLIYKKMVDSWDKLGGSRFSQICTLVCGIIFYPMIMYVSFVYGNIWSVAFALIAFEAEIDYFREYKIKSLIICILTIGLSFMAKASGIIFLIALCIFAIILGLKDKIKLYKVAVIIIAMSLSVVAFSVIPKKIMIKKTGYDIRDDGIWAFVAMALQEDGTAPGWYNGYVFDVYSNNDWNTELAEKEAKEETFNRLNYLFSDKHHAYEFFSKKVASMWIEPTFEGYWINQTRNHRVRFPGWLELFMSAKGYAAATKFFDVFEILILTGSLLWLILEEKDKFNCKSFLLLSFVGGFTFNLMWESKSQYTITYFILLFPYAMEGFEYLMEKRKEMLSSTNKVILAYSCATVVIYTAGYFLDGSNCLSQHNEVFDKYIDEWTMNDLTESTHEINNMKAKIEDYQDQCESYQEQCDYYRGLLDDNGIEY